MPTYATRTDLNNFFSAASIGDWADKDRDGLLSAAELLAIDAALEASEAIVDGHLQKAGYATPFEGAAYTAVPARLKALLRQWTVVLAGYHLYAWRGLRDKTNPVELLYREILDQLKAVAESQPLAGLIKASKVTFATGADAQDPTDQLAHLKSDAWDW